VDVAKAWT